MESYRHSGTAGSGDSSSRRYQQLPTRSDPVQQPAVAGSSGVRLATGTRDPAMLLVGPRGSSSSSSATTTDYSDSCSSSDCSSTSSWSSESIPEWESHIDAEGELFYIEFSSNLQVPTPTTDTACRQPSAEDRQEVLKKKKKKKSRLSRLLKRRAVSNGNNKGGSSAGGNEMASCESPGVYLPTEAQRSPADDWSDWTSFTLELEVHPTTGADGSSLSSGSTGRRNKGPNHLCETLLGFVPGVTQSVDWHGEVSLRQRVIVDKLTPGGPLHQGFAHVQQGDWLEKLNGQNVTHRDLNDILSSINSREIVELNFRRRPTSNDNRNQEPSGGNGGETPAPPHGIFLLSQENVTEASAETADILYQSSSNTNRGGGGGGGGTDTSNGIDPLLKWRGAIVTLAHLMPQLTGSAPPSCSTVILDGMIVHLVYIVEGSVLFLIGAPSIWCSRIELQMTAKQLASLFRFQYGSIRRALTEPRLAGEIRRMVDSLFNWLQQGAGARSVGNASTVSPGGSNDMSRPFNRLSNYFVTCGQWLPLPPESHLDVTLTLNQMEAIDYEDWDEESISIQRCATITGSAVYCQGYLVASTMAAKRLEEIGTFLKWNQILEMSHRRRLSSLIIWRQVFPESEDAGNRSFLVVVGSGHILVVALLESGGVTQSWDHYPDTFLIEEMQFFLQELQYLDLETTCNQILNGPQNPALVTNLSQISECSTPISSSPESEMPTFSITPGLRPTMINYLSMDFGTGVFVAPTILNAGTRFIDQFQKTCLTIHNLFQRTLKAKMDLQRPDWGGPWSDKSLVALQEVSVVFTVTESPPSPGSGTKSTPMSDSFWVTGRLFLSPVHRELFVCHQDGVAQDILDLAFHLAFGAVL
ncbi:protein inturned-like isoform X3 [Daphnia pulicaria]|uniref:protein inturned-like isoform X3 n=1 Tax=Daphnia pulicaria TaxID=35523 RepID=UPI001EEB963A|nr:protein inturned-like isoform X3 [Daphnia pulicaria]